MIHLKKIIPLLLVLFVGEILMRDSAAVQLNLAVFFGNTGVLFDLLAVCISPRESTIQDDCSHIFHGVISMKGESTNANCNRK